MRTSLGLAFTLLFVSGCPYLNQLNAPGGPGSVRDMAPNPPRVSVTSVKLTQAPTSDQLAGYYCAQVAPSFICRAVAPVPNQSQLKFIFDVNLNVENPNNIPLPMVEALAAFSVFPDSSSRENLGAVCLSMCQDPANCPQQSADACNTAAPQVRTMRDFATAAVNFVFNVVTGQAKLENLRIKTIPANGNASVVFRLELNPTAVLRIVKQSTQSAIDQIKRGKRPRFQIPYRIEGSVWIHVEGFAKIGAAYPPYQNTWNLL